MELFSWKVQDEIMISPLLCPGRKTLWLRLPKTPQKKTLHGTRHIESLTYIYGALNHYAKKAYQ
jgi:hypothetical protein